MTAVWQFNFLVKGICMPPITHRTVVAYHAPALFDRAIECAKNKQGVATVILCVSSIEALIHDLVECYQLAIDHDESCENKKPKIPFQSSFVCCFSELHQVTEEEVKLCNALKKIESDRGQLEDKVTEIFKSLHNESPLKGEKTWQDFALLSKIRNGIVHIKGETLTQTNPYSDENKSKIEGYPKFVKKLQRRSLIKNPETLDASKNWLELIEKEENFLAWCIDVTKKYSELILQKLPDSHMSLGFKQEARF